MFRLGQHVTVEEFYKYAPLGMELSKTVCDDYEDDPYTITLRYSLVNFHDMEEFSDSYIEYFPSGLTLKPGYLWDSEKTGHTH